MSEDAKLFGDTGEDAALFGDAPASRKSKYPDPKSFSAPDTPDTGMIKTRRVPGTPLNFVEKPEPLTPEAKAHDDAAMLADVKKTTTDLAIGGGVAGSPAAFVSKLAKPAAATAIGLNAFAKGQAKPIAELIKDAISSSMHHLAEKVMGEKGVEIAGEIAGRAGGRLAAAAPAAKAVGSSVAGAAAGELGPSTVPTPAVDEPAPFKGVMSNAVDRLRASAGNNPRAADLLARMEASKSTPTGTVTQGTGAH